MSDKEYPKFDVLATGLWVPDERTGYCVKDGTDNVCDCLGGCEVYGDDRWVEIAHNLNKEMGK